MYLALLSFWGLIELKYHTETNQQLGNHYTVYHLQKVNDKATNPDFEADIEGEKNSPLPSKELIDKLMDYCPEYFK